MVFSDFIIKKFRPDLKVIKDDYFTHKDPDFFGIHGTQVFCGRQGSGKTVSAVRTVRLIKKRYPKAMIVSNLDLKDYHALKFDKLESLKLKCTMCRRRPDKCYIQFSSLEGLELVLTQVNNGFHGVIYLIDEIHTYFNALDSKNIPIHIFTEISQQRKQRKVIIGTSQLFLRMAKPFREQCDNLIMCNTLFGLFTTTTCYDAMTLTQDYDGTLHGDVKKRGWFFHDRKLRKSYDTFQKVVSSSVQFEDFAQLHVADKKLNRKLGF